MKKNFTNFLLLPLFCLVGTTMMAQTYNGGTWYSLYDESTNSNTNAADQLFGEKAVFAPAESMTFEYKKYSLLSVNGNVEVQNKVNGSDWQAKGSVKYSDYNNWKTTSEIALDANITNIRYKMSSGTGVQVKNHFVKLKKHILLPDGTFGKTSDSKSFGNVTIDGQSDAQTVTLRSFLTAGDITIKSDDNAFRINSTSNLSGHTFAVGANACASANGQSGAQAGGGNLGDINQYAFSIYFCPSEAKTYNATITITDGTSTATIAVSGTGLKKNQTLTWNEKYAKHKLSVGQTVSDLATSFVGKVLYASSNDSVIAVINDGEAIQAIAPGEAVVYATQAGDDKWNEVTDSITFTVLEKKVQFIHWADNLTRLKLGVDSALVLTATAQVIQENELVDAPERTAFISYQSADSSVVTINGDTLIIVGEGETTLTAILPGDDTYEEATATMPVRVRVPSTACESYVLSATDEYSLEYSVFWQERIYEPAAFSGPGHILTFEARKNEATAVGNIQIQQYVNGEWQTIDDANPGTDWREYYYELDPNATKIRFYNGYGSYHRYWKNVLVTQRTYLETTTPAITVEKSIIGDHINETIAIQYSNLPDNVMITHTSSQTQLSDSEIKSACGVFGEKFITLTAQPTAVGTILDTITVHEETTGFTLTIPVAIHTQRYNQSIDWNDSIETLVATDIVTLTATAVNEITYSTSDSSIAYVDSLSQLVIQAAGVVTITAHATESELYAPALLSRTITILHAEQAIEWNLVNLILEVGDSVNLYTDINTAVATSGLEVAYDYGTDWANYVAFDDLTGTIVAVAEGVIYMTAYQDGNHIYAPAEDVMATLTVVAKGTATGVENTPVQTTAIKQIINGQLVIIHNGQTYDIQGRVIR